MVKQVKRLDFERSYDKFSLGQAGGADQEANNVVQELRIVSWRYSLGGSCMKLGGPCS